MLELNAPLWRRLQRLNIRQLDRLADFLDLDISQRERLKAVSSFPLNVPLRIAEKMEKGNLDDPIFRQFVSLEDLEPVSSDFLEDPIADKDFRKSQKLLHKYEGRALLLCTSSCAMHCRFCFRQHYPYEQERRDFAEELELLSRDAGLSELILSGGDPLSLSNARLATLFESLDEIPHIKRIRFHTRFPIGIPERIDEGFLSFLDRSSKQVWFIIHCNHPRELDDDVCASLKLVQRLGIPVLNQWVLLKGVNDDLAVQKELCEALVDVGVVPYYLHHLDRVQGAESFETDKAEGRALIEALRSQLSGYAVPRYVQEQPGEDSKTILI